MSENDVVIGQIRRAFGDNEFPGAAYLQGSFEGGEPFEEVEPFGAQPDWQAVPAEFLDGHAGALSFFSEAGFRFFLPAYLIADLQDRLNTADPLFHLIHGFYDISVQVPRGARTFEVTTGKSALVNPRRYGATTFYDYARYRLSVFTREEAGAIVEYLRWKRERVMPHERAGIDAALDLFWLERARSAPEAEALKRHLKDLDDFVTGAAE